MHCSTTPFGSVGSGVEVTEMISHAGEEEGAEPPPACFEVAE